MVMKGDEEKEGTKRLYLIKRELEPPDLGFEYHVLIPLLVGDEGRSQQSGEKITIPADRLGNG